MAESVRAADAVVQHIEKCIRDGQLPDGGALPPERDLMQTYGVSRTVVREAVRILSSRGLVEALPRHRPTVRKPGYDAAVAAVEGIIGHLLREEGGVKNLFDTRILIEAALVREAARDATKEDIAALARALRENKAVIEDNEAFFRSDIAFHAVLFEIPRNPVLPAIHRAYATWLSPQWSRMRRQSDRNRLNYLAHEEILNGIMMRDPDLAEAALRKHLAEAWDQVAETFEYE